MSACCETETILCYRPNEGAYILYMHYRAYNMTVAICWQFNPPFMFAIPLCIV